jgi:autotransporter-associated beta strand protein
VDVKGLIDLTRNASNPNNKAYTEKFGVWINGGTLKPENIMMTATSAKTAKVYFNGGIYMPYGAAAANRTMQNLNKCYVSTNGAVVSTENLPADAVYTIAQPLLQDPSGVDGGLRKIGAGTLALSGANTYTGVTEVAVGTLVVASAEALSARVSVADGAALDLDGQSVALAGIDASGAVQNGSLTVTNALFLGASGSILSVDGDVALDGRVVIDFGLAPDATPDIAWRPVLAASGSISVPANVHIGGCGGKYNRCATMVQDGVLYVRPTSVGLVIYLQ